MKYLLIPSTIVLSFLASCYSVEDAADVNQERIQTIYQTEFNMTRETTSAQIKFQFGQTPLKMSNASYFEASKLHEKKDVIFGLHYRRKLEGVATGEYQWTDETGKIFYNPVALYSFDLDEPVDELKKYTYYKLPWSGDNIPSQADDFTITIESYVDGTICSFHVGELIEIHSDHLINLPEGNARLTISRNYSDKIEEKTQAGGDSHVCVVREYEISIIE